MTLSIRRRVASDTARLPLRAYETVLRETPARRAISPMSMHTPNWSRIDSMIPSGAGRVNARAEASGRARTPCLDRRPRGAYSPVVSANRFDARLEGVVMSRSRRHAGRTVTGARRRAAEPRHLDRHQLPTKDGQACELPSPNEG